VEEVIPFFGQELDSKARPTLSQMDAAHLLTIHTYNGTPLNVRAKIT